MLSKILKTWVIFVTILSMVIFPSHEVHAQSTYTVLMLPVGPLASTTGIGQEVIPPARYSQPSVQFVYGGGTVTLSACADRNCSWAIDDEVEITVTRPDTTTAVRTFSSFTQEKLPEVVSNLFQVGTNSISVVLIDRFGNWYGLPRTLYLVESAGALPDPTLRNEAIPAGMNYSTNTGYSRDPVNNFTGAFTYMRTDVAIAGRGPTPAFVRSYNSADTRIGVMGPGWKHSYDVYLASPSQGSQDIVVVRGDGRSDLYIRNQDGSYTPPSGVDYILVKNADGISKLTAKNQTSWVFGETGVLLRIVDRYGNQSTLSYNGSNQLTSVSDPAGRGVLTFNYNGSGQLASVTDWIGRSVNFGYDANGRLQTVTDRASKVTTYGYDGTSSRLTTITDAQSHVVVTNTYDAQGRVATQKDALGLTTGQQTTFSYVTNQDGTRTTTVTYPKTSFETTWNHVEVDTYDAQGRLTQRVSKPVSTSGNWITESYGYDSNGFRNSYSDGNAKTTLYCYDVSYSGGSISGSRGNLTRRIDPPPTTGAIQPVTLYQYDSKNNLIQEISPKGVSSSTSVTCSTNLSNNLNQTYATNYAYDSTTQTLLESISRSYSDPDLGAVSALTIYQYGDTANPGMVTKVIPPRGNNGQSPDDAYATTYVYGSSGTQAGMLLTLTEPLGKVTTYGYDAVGRLTSMVDPLSHTWQYAYDNEDRQTSVSAPAPTSGGNPLVTQYQYDNVGNRIFQIDANGQVTKYVYDERDNLKEVHESPDAWTDPNSPPSNIVVTGYQYDNLGNLKRMIRAQGNSTYERATDYVYDGLGRVRKEIQYPSWPSTTTKLTSEFTYDKNSNRLTIKDPLTKTTTHGYDALNRLTSITYNSTSTPNVSYAYDANGNRTSMVDGNGTTSYTYDSWNRLLTVTSPGNVVVAYRYDQHGNRRKLIYPDNTAVIYSFDEADRLNTVVDWSNRTTSYSYFVDGSVQTLTQANGTSTHYSYDNAGRLTQVWNKYGNDTFTRHTYTLDGVGNRTHIDEVLSTPASPGPITTDRQGTIDFVYDRMYRLTSENRVLPNPQDTELLQYTYDPAGNRLSKTRTESGFNPETTNFTYDKADRVQTATGDLEENYTIDANGNMTDRYFSIAHQVHVYDQANRLIRAEPQSIYKYHYKYDGDGNRTKVRRQSGSTTEDLVSYVNDVSQPLPVVIQDTWHKLIPVETHKYVWGLGLLYVVTNSQTQSNVPGFYALDGLGSVRVISDNDAPPDREYFEEYEAFGNEGWSNDLYNQAFLYAGELDDEAIGDAKYIYLRARYYDPSIGRFLTKDPEAGSTTSPLSLNRYSYVGNNPVNFTDPSGKYWQFVAAGVVTFEFVKLALFDNARELSDDGVRGETDDEWLLKVIINTGTGAAFHRTGSKYIDPIVTKTIHPNYPKLGSKPDFPNTAWWLGVRQRIEFGKLYMDRMAINPTQTSLLNWINRQLYGDVDYSKYMCVNYTTNMCFGGKK